MDLRVGGRFIVENEPTQGTALLISGEFLVIQPPDKLVYTWRFHTPQPEDSVVTVEFRGVGEQTEVVVTHEYGSKDMGPSAMAAWTGALGSLARILAD